MKFVLDDESLLKVGKDRVRKWATREETFVYNNSAFSFRCICVICDDGSEHCRLFNRTMNSDVFTAYARTVPLLFV